MIDRDRLSLWALWLSLMAFAISLFLPGYTTDYYGKLQEHFGLEAFILGPIGLFAGHVSWVANPFLLISWSRRTGPNWGLSFIFAAVAFAFALSFLLPKGIAVGSAGEFPYSAAAGYYVWLMSIGVAATAALLYKSSPTEASSVNAA